MKNIDIGGVEITGRGLFFILGPCVIEDEKSTLNAAGELKKITGELGVPFIFKASYDKANRTSVTSFRGPGIDEGLKILAKVRSEFAVPVLTDVHSIEDIKKAGEVVDCLQIPAFLCRQTDILVEAGRTGLPVNIKKGQFMAPLQMTEAAKKVSSTGNENVFITERGTTFGYNDLVVDFRSVPIIRGQGLPVVFDATHSVQKPGGLGSCSGGDREFVVHLASAASAVGVDGVFMEVHPEPESAKCDGPNSIAIKDLAPLLSKLIEIDKAARKGNR